MIVIDNYKQTVFKGKVVSGRQVGRKLGFPTANLHVSSEEEPFLPKGVYGVRVYHGDVSFNGVMNIGMRPTFKDERSTVSYEVHNLNFNQDIYGEQLLVDILFFIREEQAFETIEKLVKQLNHDIEKANKQFLLLNC